MFSFSCKGVKTTTLSSRKDNLVYKQTLTVSGFLIFDLKKGKDVFYVIKDEVLKDTLQMLTKLNKSKPSYQFIQPYIAKTKRNFRDYEVCSQTMCDAYIKQIRVSKKCTWYFAKNEDCIILSDSLGKMYLSFKYAKPLVSRYY